MLTSCRAARRAGEPIDPKVGSATLQPRCMWQGLWSTRTVTIVFALVVAIGFGSAFAVSVTRDRRRFRNGIYLLLATLFLLMWLWGRIVREFPFAQWLSAVFFFALIPLTIVLLGAFLVANGVTMI